VCGFVFAFHSNYGSNLHHFGDKARYWSKIVIFSYPAHSTPPLPGSQSEYCHKVWDAKISKFCILATDEQTKKTDRQTHRRTDGQHRCTYLGLSLTYQAALAVASGGLIMRSVILVISLTKVQQLTEVFCTCEQPKSSLTFCKTPQSICISVLGLPAVHFRWIILLANIKD